MKHDIPAARTHGLTRAMKFAVATLALLVGTVAPAAADRSTAGNLGNPAIAPPQSHFRGLSYGEWVVAWFQWAYSLPVTNHPLFDTADCSAGQTGDVWFIDGTRGPVPFPEDGRDCTIPAGTALFLSVAAQYSDNEGCAGLSIQRTSFSESQLRAFAHNNLNSFLGTRLVIVDGVAVQGLPECVAADESTCESPYRVQSPVYDYTVPAHDNILALFDDGPCYDSPPRPEIPYTAQGAVADGVFVMIKPLPVGTHTIQFGLVDPATGEPNRLYNITVTGKSK